MPIYEYECTKCKQRFDLRRKIDDSDRDISCPKCGAKFPRRVFSTFSTNYSTESCAPSQST